jgi:hypothetical protein
MEKTRKAFVVLAAAVTAGNYIGCGSNTPKAQDTPLADAASQADTQGPDAITRADTQGPDVASQTDTQGSDAATQTDTQVLDATSAIDAQAVADVGKESVMLNADASVSSPDSGFNLSMPSGSLYDVLVRSDVA